MLVTGANGFIGRWLVEALVRRGASVHALVRTQSRDTQAWFNGKAKLVYGEITDLERFSKLLHDSQIDLVYHLAAVNTNTGANISPHDVFEANLRGTYTILEACRRMPAPISVIISSSKEAEDCFRPNLGRKHHPYMASKAGAELISLAYCSNTGIAVAVARLANIYGGGDLNWNRLVPGMMRAVLHGETPFIRSNGLLQRDYVYVEDAVAAFLAIGARLHQPEVRGQLFRVTTGIGTSVLDMVNQIAHTAGRPDLKPQVLSEKTEERVDTFYTPELEQRVLKWSSQTSLAEGLKRTCEWYQGYFKK